MRSRTLNRLAHSKHLTSLASASVLAHIKAARQERITDPLSALHALALLLELLATLENGHDACSTKYQRAAFLFPRSCLACPFASSFFRML